MKRTCFLLCFLLFHGIGCHAAVILKGRVTDEKDQPVGGVKVQIESRLGSKYEWAHQSVTGEDGCFESGPLADEAEYQINLSATGFAPRQTAWRKWQSDSKIDDFVLWRLSGVAEGVVRDISNHPVAGAQVWADTLVGRSQTNSDAEGKFRLTNLPPRLQLFFVRQGNGLPGVVQSLPRSGLVLIPGQFTSHSKNVPPDAKAQRQFAAHLQEEALQQVKDDPLQLRNLLPFLARLDVSRARRLAARHGISDALRFTLADQALQKSPPDAQVALAHWKSSGEGWIRYLSWQRIKNVADRSPQILTHLLPSFLAAARALPTSNDRLSYLIQLYPLVERAYPQSAALLLGELETAVGQMPFDFYGLQYRGAVAQLLVKTDVERALSLVRNASTQKERLRGDDFFSHSEQEIALSLVLAPHNPERALKILDENKRMNPGWTRGLFCRAVCLSDLPRAEKMAASLEESQWRMQAFTWMHEKWQARDRGIAHRLLRRAIAEGFAEALPENEKQPLDDHIIQQRDQMRARLAALSGLEQLPESPALALKALALRRHTVGPDNEHRKREDADLVFLLAVAHPTLARAYLQVLWPRFAAEMRDGDFHNLDNALFAAALCDLSLCKTMLNTIPTRWQPYYKSKVARMLLNSKEEFSDRIRNSTGPRSNTLDWYTQG